MKLLDEKWLRAGGALFLAARVDLLAIHPESNHTAGERIESG